MKVKGLLFSMISGCVVAPPVLVDSTDNYNASINYQENENVT